MEIIVEHSKMRKDASKLRNRNLKMKIVELHVGFPVVVSKMRKDAYFSRNRQKTIKKYPYYKYVLLQLGELFNFIITRTHKVVSLSNNQWFAILLSMYKLLTSYLNNCLNIIIHFPSPTQVQGFFDLLSKEFSFCSHKTFSHQKSMEILMEYSKMCRDG